MKELELMRSRVEELQNEQKNSHRTIGQLSAQREELEQANSRHSRDLEEFRKVSRSFKSSLSEKFYRWIL